MTKTRRMIALLLCVAFAAALLAGCSNKTTTGSGTASKGADANGDGIKDQLIIGSH